MKKYRLLLLLVFTMMMSSLSCFAQDITITISPGWNWISYPKSVEMSLGDAFVGFVPVEGDVLKSQMDFSVYHDGQWFGGLQSFIPGMGYLYRSNRNEVSHFVFGEVDSQLTVTTVAPSDITFHSAFCGGTVAVSEGSHVFAKGVCWSTEPNPTVDDNHTMDSSGMDSWGSIVSGLTQGITYHVRAYAVSDIGLKYGEDLSFTTANGDNPDPAYGGLFSVSDEDQVYFSRGNLQYIGSASTPYWKFAEHPWDVLGSTTGQNSDNEFVDRDLFCWGTSGYDHGSVCYQPWSVTMSNADYFAYGDNGFDLCDQTGQADWGFNPISNGGNQPNQWRTLTNSEWFYVFFSRPTSSGARFAKAQVSEVNGVILLPDDWDVSYFTLENINGTGNSFSSNVITAEDWSMLEQHGAVFLPFAGSRSGVYLSDVNAEGCYWSASHDGGSYAYFMYLTSDNITSTFSNRFYGFSVRLVRYTDQN